jgi:outer membrane murein-binding lipoprotein Lpp
MDRTLAKHRIDELTSDVAILQAKKAELQDQATKGQMDHVSDVTLFHLKSETGNSFSEENSAKLELILNEFAALSSNVTELRNTVCSLEFEIESEIANRNAAVVILHLPSFAGFDYRPTTVSLPRYDPDALIRHSRVLWTQVSELELRDNEHTQKLCIDAASLMSEEVRAAARREEIPIRELRASVHELSEIMLRGTEKVTSLAFQVSQLRQKKVAVWMNFEQERAKLKAANHLAMTEMTSEIRHLNSERSRLARQIQQSADIHQMLCTEIDKLANEVPGLLQQRLARESEIAQLKRDIQSLRRDAAVRVKKVSAELGSLNGQIARLSAEIAAIGPTCVVDADIR